MEPYDEMSLNHKRTFVPGLDQHTSTNAESGHYSIKYGDHKVTASMSTTKSCNIQCNKAEIRAEEMAKNFAQKASKNLVQEDSNTREFLTPWAEEMVCRQRSQMNHYRIVQVSKSKFLMNVDYRDQFV